MACYGAVVSLEDIMERLLLQSSKLNREMTKVVTAAQEEVRAVQNLLRKLDAIVENEINVHSPGWKKMNSIYEVLRCGGSSGSSIRKIGRLDGKMREAALQLEDTLETHLLNHHHHQLDRLQQHEKLKQDVDSFSRTVMEFMEEYARAGEAAEEEENEEEEEDDDLASGKEKKKMVGYSDVLAQMKDGFIVKRSWVVIVAMLVGMAGIGKTTLARRFFEDPEISGFYNYRVWVTVGQKFQFIDILKSILDQVDPGNTLTEGFDMVSRFKVTMTTRKCLVVLDDVWSKETIPPVRDLLRRAMCYCSASTLLVTSRQEKIGAKNTYPWGIKMIKVRFMNKDESWDLLRDSVFGEDLTSQTTCTPQLLKAGMKIAENCEGLPLTIVTVADILSKADDMTPEYWNQVAESQNSVFVDAYRQMSKVLLRSYKFLPRHLKECFLYMGVFPPKYDIALSKLALLWGVEGCFLPISASKKFKYLQAYVSMHVEELIGVSLVLVRKTAFNRKPKTYSLHPAFWHPCVGEAVKNKFFHVFNKYADILEAERMRNQTRLCVHNNVLFGIKDVCDSITSISTARSLLCTGRHHRFPVPVCFNHLRLLRVIEALTIRFYEFPTQVVELVRLRYLALACDGKLPTSISKLSNLEILIVGRYLNIVKLHEKEESYLPMEIWDMKQLQHLQVMGDDLPEPRAGIVLPNLVTLIDANARNFTKGVLKGLPNLKKLGIRIELSTLNAETLSISYHNNELESFKCVVVNPVFRWSPIVSCLFIPNSLKKLSLNGLGCPWGKINEVVASLPKLEELKLRCYAFRGAKWETPKNGFKCLEYLLIEDTDLVHWTLGNRSFSRLRCLVLKQCYKLQVIQPFFRKPLNKIEIVDCNPSVLLCVKKMQAIRRKLEVFVNSSWNDDGKKLKA